MHRIKPDIQFVRINSLEELTPDFWIDYFMDFTHHIMFDQNTIMIQLHWCRMSSDRSSRRLVNDLS
jgi:hypothetical protein